MVAAGRWWRRWRRRAGGGGGCGGGGGGGGGGPTVGGERLVGVGRRAKVRFCPRLAAPGPAGARRGRKPARLDRPGTRPREPGPAPAPGVDENQLGGMEPWSNAGLDKAGHGRWRPCKAAGRAGGERGGRHGSRLVGVERRAKVRFCPRFAALGPAGARRGRNPARLDRPGTRPREPGPARREPWTETGARPGRARSGRPAQGQAGRRQVGPAGNR